MYSTGVHVHILRNAPGVGHIISMTSLTLFFAVERCQASALLNALVSLSFSLDGQMNM